MKIDILTLFPKMFQGPFDQSIIKRAQQKDLVEINIHNLRNWAKDKHKTVDDRPYGGGPGMIIKVDIISKALKSIKSKNIKLSNSKTILLSPQGKVFNQKKARQFSKEKNLILICGHYEGFDERIRKHLIDEEISIGRYILTGGELPAMIVVDTVARLIPGVLEKKAIENESFSKSSKKHRQPLLDYPQYTRPEKFKEWKVPEILLSGNHQKIKKWRENEAIKKTISKQKQSEK